MFATGADVPGATSGTGKRQREGLPVPTGPLGDDIGNQTSIMPAVSSMGRPVARLMSRRCIQVSRVKIGVDQVAERPTFGLERRVLLHTNGPAHRRRCSPPGLHGLGARRQRDGR